MVSCEKSDSRTLHLRRFGGGDERGDLGGELVVLTESFRFMEGSSNHGWRIVVHVVICQQISDKTRQIGRAHV